MCPDNSSGGCRSRQSISRGGGCGEDLGCCYNSCPWYVSLTALGLTRNNPNKLWLSNEPFPTEYNQLMNSQYPENWQFGGEIKFGRRFCCDCCDPCGNNSNGYWAIEADYWTTIPFSGSETCVNPNGGTLGTPLVVGDIAFRAIDGSTQQGTFWFNDATEHAFGGTMKSRAWKSTWCTASGRTCAAAIGISRSPSARVLPLRRTVAIRRARERLRLGPDGARGKRT